MKLQEHQKQTIIHIDKDVYEKARVIAGESQRSFDNLVELCLRRMITQFDKND